jgi:O-antigen ligase
VIHSLNSFKKNIQSTGLLSSILISTIIVGSLALDLSLLILILFFFGVGVIFYTYKDWEVSYYELILITLIIVFIGPPIKLAETFPVIRPEQLLFLSLYPLLAYWAWNKLDTNLALKKFIYLYGFFLLYMFSSIFYGKFTHSITIGYKDFMEVIRFFQYGCVILFIGTVKLNLVQLDKLLKSIVFLFFIAGLIGVFQYYGILGLDKFTAPLYSESRIWQVNNRMYGTFINPNTFGTFMAVSIIFALGMMVYDKKFLNKFFYLIVFVLSFWVLALSESRTAFITLFFGIVFLIVSYSRFLGYSLSRLILITSIVFLFILGLFLSLDAHLIRRFETILNFMEDRSWQMRLFAWYINFQIFLESWLLGLGPAYHHYTPIVDNEYLIILRRYGIIGFSIYIWFYVLPLWRAIKNTVDNNLGIILNSIFISTSVIFLVGNITNQIFHEMQFMGFWAVVVGLIFNVNNNKKFVEVPN